ncbi:identical protein binding [Sparganum proliferum]
MRPESSLFESRHPENTIDERIKEILACLHIPSLWAEFVTVYEAALPKGLVGYRTYRQAFVEPIPFTVWAAARWPIRYRPPGAPRQRVLWQEDLANQLRSPPSLPEPISLLVNLDSPANPVTVFTYRSASGSSRPAPIRLILGHSGSVFTIRSTRLMRLPDAVDHLAFLFGLVHQVLRLRASVALDSADVLSRLSSDDDGGGGIKVFHEWLFTAKFSLSRGLRLEVEASPEDRQLPPSEEEYLTGQFENEEETASHEGLDPDSKSTGEHPSVHFERVHFTATENSSLEDELANGNDEELKKLDAVYSQALKAQVIKSVATESVLAPEAHGLGSPMTGSTPSLDKLNARGHFPTSLPRSKEMECITVDDVKSSPVRGDHLRVPSTTSLSSLEEAFNGNDDFVPIGFNDLCDDDELLGSVLEGSGGFLQRTGNSFVEGLLLPDEIVTEKPEEIGAEAFTDDQNSGSPSTEEPSVGVFPPWHVDRLIVDFRDPTLDGDLSTVELRGWLGIGSVEIAALESAGEASAAPDISSVTNEPAFWVSFRAGGESLPGQPTHLLTPYDGWMAMQISMTRDTVLRLSPVSWQVVQHLLHTIGLRGGVEVLSDVITQGPGGGGGGSIPLHNPPEILDFSFLLTNGSLTFCFDSPSSSAASFAPVRKITVQNGFCAALDSSGVLKIRTGPSAPSMSSPTTPVIGKTPPPLPRRPPPPAFYVRENSMPTPSSLSRSGSTLNESSAFNLRSLATENAELKKTVC